MDGAKIGTDRSVHAASGMDCFRGICGALGPRGAGRIVWVGRKMGTDRSVHAASGMDCFRGSCGALGQSGQSPFFAICIGNLRAVAKRRKLPLLYL